MKQPKLRLQARHIDPDRTISTLNSPMTAPSTISDSSRAPSPLRAQPPSSSSSAAPSALRRLHIVPDAVRPAIPPSPKLPFSPMSSYALPEPPIADRRSSKLATIDIPSPPLSIAASSSPSPSPSPRPPPFHRPKSPTLELAAPAQTRRRAQVCARIALKMAMMLRSSHIDSRLIRASNSLAVPATRARSSPINSQFKIPSRQFIDLHKNA